jgi:flavin reductase (DIM6/NTAB) family NADH-FMN oxidoreductase RutF/DNA-binding MarR family transcriptional regulator
MTFHHSQELVESGDPKEDLSAFRRCLGQFATGVTIVTARSGDELVGMTANSFSSVSLDPPLVLWSAKRTSSSFAAFEAAAHFAVNVLASDQVHLSKHFGRSGHDKFAGIPWRAGLGGSPILDGAVASFECRRTVDYPGGDHLIFIGEVQRFARYDREALLFAQGLYSIATEHPDLADSLAPSADRPAGPMNDFITALMYRAHGNLSAALDEGREAEGLTVLQTRVMAAIETLPNSTLRDLLPELFLGSNTAQSTLGDLIHMGLVQVGSGGELSLTNMGRTRNTSLLRRARAIEARELSGLPAQDVAACRRVLDYLVRRRRTASQASSDVNRNLVGG